MASKKADYTPEQYQRQLEHARSWKERNREKVRKYNSDYHARKRAERKQRDSQG